ncbi:MAG: diphosphomevalonate decarboxylase [Deltaproteobacteria bacterium RIFOXYA12_FULL_58_15]|nr:MAG: diphosphomevalonate decarboxylase [Deltaproteobacteria bacterium RIFOXYA12_FULL_58_15]
MNRRARAKAQANIALVKYWGKRDVARNLPAVGSISVTLADLSTETEVVAGDSVLDDSFELNGSAASPQEMARIGQFLDRMRGAAGVTHRAKIVSANNFPTGAGLASSASGFAALTLATSAAFGMDSSAKELSVLARLGSGSAPRSLLGGFVEMAAGRSKDGSDAVATQLFDESHWPLDILVAVTTEAAKKTGSTAGMQQSSAYFSAWVDGANADLAAARAAIGARDIEALGTVAEHSCLKMHAVALAAKPGLLYWNAATVALIHAVREGRSSGIAMFFTIDAGPQVKVFCEAKDATTVARIIEGVDGVARVIRTSIGPGAVLLD